MCLWLFSKKKEEIMKYVNTIIAQINIQLDKISVTVTAYCLPLTFNVCIPVVQVYFSFSIILNGLTT